jgi:hypothetical protein
MVVAGFAEGGASGSGELAWVTGAVVTGAVVTGVWADAAWVDAVCVDDGDEPQPDRPPARMAAATTATAIDDFLMPHPLVCPARDEPTERGYRAAHQQGSREIQPS